VANHPSAVKRTRQNEKRRLRNSAWRSRVHTEVKKLHAAIEQKNPQAVKEQLSRAVSFIMRARGKGVLHWRTAARKISRLNLLAARVLTAKSK